MAKWKYNGLEPFIEYDASEIGKELQVLRDLEKIESKKLGSVLSLLSLHQSLGRETPESILSMGLIARNKVIWLKDAIAMRKLEKEAGE